MTAYVVTVDGREVLRTFSLANAVRRATRYGAQSIRITAQN